MPRLQIEENVAKPQSDFNPSSTLLYQQKPVSRFKLCFWKPHWRYKEFKQWEDSSPQSRKHPAFSNPPLLSLSSNTFWQTYLLQPVFSGRQYLLWPGCNRGMETWSSSQDIPSNASCFWDLTLALPGTGIKCNTVLLLHKKNGCFSIRESWLLWLAMH